MERNIAPISFAFPGAERNLMRAKAPAKAIPIPMLSFTTRITTATTAGRSATVETKLSLYLLNTA